MPYDVSVADAKLKVDVRVLGTDRFTVLLDGVEVAVEPRVVPGGVLLCFGDRIVDVVVGGADPSAPFVASGPHRARVTLETERQRMARERRRGLADDGQKNIVSPMHGRVVKVLVEAGSPVAAGQAVAVVEAMKMENEIRARGAGVVREVRVAPGAAVEVKTVLVVLE